MTRPTLGSSAPDRHLGKSVGHMPDSEIDFSDMRESTDAELAGARRVGRPRSGQTKEPPDSIDSRLGALKEVAMTLLGAVDSLRSAEPAAGGNVIKLQDEVQRFETELIRTALERAGGSPARAARLLGVKHSTLNAKIKRYRISISNKAEAGGGNEIAA